MQKNHQRPNSGPRSNIIRVLNHRKTDSALKLMWDFSNAPNYNNLIPLDPKGVQKAMSRFTENISLQTSLLKILFNLEGEKMGVVCYWIGQQPTHSIMAP